MQEEVIWKRIPNYSLYEASTNGEIKTYNWKNKKVEAIMKPAFDGCGYLRTMLKNDNGKYDTIKVHRIIAHTFIPNPENKKTVNHKNGIKHDNNVKNLEWATQQENNKHANEFLKWDFNKGENVGTATLTDAQAQEILDNYEFGKKGKKGITKQQIADKYGVKFCVIKSLVRRVTWSHLTPKSK